jgi:acyl-CoA dehydrogenase family protein 9
MSETSLLKALFRGEIPESLLFPFPELAPREADAVHRTLEAARGFFASSVDSIAIDQDATIPASVLDGLKELGLFGLLVPERYGGAGLCISGYARVMEELSGLDASIAVVVGAHQSIGLQALLRFGTDEQKARYLPDLARGRSIAAFALSELGAGSDAASVLTRAEKVDGGYRIHGDKAWTTNGAIADVFTVFARTGSANDGRKPRITAFLVERGEGVTIGPDAPKLGIRGVTTPTVRFDGVFVPDSAVLGEPGRGFHVAMDVLNAGRLGLAAGCVGASKHAIKLAVDRARDRRAFGRPIGEFGLIKDKIATMMAETYALESATYLTTGLVDAHAGDIALESAACKVLGSETLWRVVGETLQIAAGAGYMREHPYERMLRDSRIHLIFEGTNEILRSFIALSGIQGPGETMKDVQRAFREPMRGLGTLGDFALRKAKTALGRERFTKVHPALAREAALVEGYVNELARASERALRKHGRNIGEMQYTQRRLADMAIDLYTLSAVVARTSRQIERHGVEAARRKLNLAAIFAGIAERRLDANLAAFDHNDDELRKSVASRAYDDGGYALDVL